jgi:hypothetical protein
MIMNKNFAIILFILLYSFLTACENKKDKVLKNTNSLSYTPGLRAPGEEYGSPLNIVNKSDTLKILIEASDYGEWGGHREKILIQRNQDNKIFARFIKDTVPYEVIEKGGIGVLNDKLRVIVLDKTKLLNVNDEKLISIFLQRLLELYLKHEVHANSGTVYQVINTNSTLNFTYWNSGDFRDTYYGIVRKYIFGDILKKQ